MFAGSSYGQQPTPPLSCRVALDTPYTTADLRTERFKFLRIVDNCRIAVSDAAGRERMFYMDLGGAASGVLRVIAGRPLAQLTQVELQLTRTDQVIRLFAVDDPPPLARVAARIVVSPITATLAVGATMRFSALVSDAGGVRIADAPLIWESSDATIASVDTGGLVTARKPGTAQILARDRTNRRLASDIRLVRVR